MNELEEKLSGILNDPATMQQIMGMAKMLSSQPAAQNSPPQPSGTPGTDPGMLKNLTGILSKGGTDSHQQSLLTALQPYLSRERIQRLERAMHAARMAQAASTILGGRGNYV